MMTDKAKDKGVEEKDFLRSLDALETLAKGEIVPTGETEDLEKSAAEPAAEPEAEEVIEKSKPAEPTEPAEDLEKAEPQPEGDDDDDDLKKAEPEDDDNDEDENEETEKSFAQTAIEGSENIEKAVEVSDFLADLVDQVGEALDRIEKSMQARIETIEKSIANIVTFNGELAKSLKMSFEAMDGGIEDLRKSVDEMADAPLHSRKSLTTLEKSFGTDEDGQPKAPNKAQVLGAMQTALEKSVDGITATDIVRFEATGEILPHVSKVLGLK